MTVAFDCGGRQSQGLLHGQRDAVCPCFRQRQLVSINALVALGKFRVVGVAYEPDRHAVLLPQVVERLPHLSGEGFGNGIGLVLIPQWRDEVFDTRPRRLAVLESHLAHGLDAANLDALGVIGPVRLVRPFPWFLVDGQMSLNRLGRLGHVDLTGA